MGCIYFNKIKLSIFRLMKKILIIIFTIGIVGSLAYWAIETYGVNDELNNNSIADEITNEDYEIQNGDIIFHTSTSSQSKAIQLATNSKYSHMGIIYENNDEFYVYEAVQPVKLTPLKDWINRGYKSHYVIKRLKNSDDVLTPSILSKMKKIGERFEGKPYDSNFEWSDDKIYCSELVWKIYYEATGIEIGTLEKLSDFDLSSDIVKTIMQQRYGDNIPMDEPVISPAAMFNSDKLKTIREN